MCVYWSCVFPCFHGLHSCAFPLACIAAHSLALHVFVHSCAWCMCGVYVNSEHVFRHSSFPRFSHLRAPPHSLAFLVFLHMCIWSKNATDENAEYRESSVSEFPCAPVPSRSIRARSRIPPRSRAHALPRAPWPPFPRALPLPVAHVLTRAREPSMITRASEQPAPCARARLSGPFAPCALPLPVPSLPCAPARAHVPSCAIPPARSPVARIPPAPAHPAPFPHHPIASQFRHT